MSNFVLISGKIVNDIAYFKDGTVGRVRLMHSRKDSKSGDWIREYYDVVCFGYVVDNLRALQKDDRIIVSGRLSQSTFTNKAGTKVTTTGIMANEINKIVYAEKNWQAAAEAPEGYPDDRQQQESGKLPWDE